MGTHDFVLRFDLSGDGKSVSVERTVGDHTTVETYAEKSFSVSVGPEGAFFVPVGKTP